MTIPEISDTKRFLARITDRSCLFRLNKFRSKIYEPLWKDAAADERNPRSKTSMASGVRIFATSGSTLLTSIFFVSDSKRFFYSGVYNTSRLGISPIAFLRNFEKFKRKIQPFVWLQIAAFKFFKKNSFFFVFYLNFLCFVSIFWILFSFFSILFDFFRNESNRSDSLNISRA